MHSLQIQSECKIKHKTKINLYQTPTHTFLNTFFIIKYISISSLFGSGSFSIYITNLNDNLEPPSVQNNERSACKHVLNYDEGWMLCVTSFFFYASPFHVGVPGCRYQLCFCIPCPVVAHTGRQQMMSGLVECLPPA